MDYAKELKSGFHLGGDFIYYFNRAFGRGAKYRYFNTRNQVDDIYIEYGDGSRRYGKMSDNITHNLIGPSFSTRFLHHNDCNIFYVDYLIGYMSYKNNFVVIDNYKMTGSTVSFSMEAGYDWKIAESMAVGVKLSLMSGTLMKYDLFDGNTTETVKLEKDDYMSLYRFDVSVGLRFIK